MIVITAAMLPKLLVAPGSVTIADPLPLDAVLTPKVAMQYAARLIDAAVEAEGDKMLHEDARRRV